MDLRVVPLAQEHIPFVADLIQTQQRRQLQLDPRLSPVQDWQTLKRRLDSHLGVGLIVSDKERIRGYACPDVWELPESSLLSAFLTERNGIAKCLTLPDQEEGAGRVANLLLSHLSLHWQRAATTGALIRWPSADVASIQTLLLDRHQFQLDSECAFAPPPRPLFEHRPCPKALTIRPAHKPDEAVLLDLLGVELEYHAMLTPFVRGDERALVAFQKKLGKLWEGGRLQEGAPMILVAEMERRVVGMIQFGLLTAQTDAEPGYTRAGVYGCIDNLSVRGEFWGQGIGRQLVQLAFEVLEPMELAGYLLWYNPDNTLAASFWQRLGYRALWTTFQRLHPHWETEEHEMGLETNTEPSDSLLQKEEQDGTL